MFTERPQLPARTGFVRHRAGDDELFGAAFDSARFVENSTGSFEALQEAYRRQAEAVRALTGVTLDDPFAVADAAFSRQGYAPLAATGAPADMAALLAEQRALRARRVQELGAQYPDIAALPDPDEDALAIARAADQRFGQLLESRDDLWKWAPAFAGGGLGALRDPVTIGSLFLGGGAGGARTIAGRIVTTAYTEALVNAATEAAIQPAVQAWRDKAGLPAGFDEAVANVGFAALFGGVLGGGGRAVGEVLGRMGAVLPERTQNALGGDVAAAMEAIRELPPAALSPETRGALQAIEREDLVSGRSGPAASDAQIAAIAEVSARPAPEIVRTETGARALAAASETAPSRGGMLAVTPSGFRVEVRPELVRLADLTQASGDLQPRDRTRAASDAQIEDIAIRLDPLRLQPSADATGGAPIVGPDNVIESGNGRIRAIRRAFESYPERYAAYVEDLRGRGHDVPAEGGPYALVSRRVTPLEGAARVKFVNEANASAIARMSSTEIARMDRQAMTADVLDQWTGGQILSARNAPFVARFLDQLPQSERGALVDAAGHVNADGLRRIENALIAAAYGDTDIIARFTEGADDNVRAITGAMADVAPEWAIMRTRFASGELNADLDPTAFLLDALRLISRWREQAVREKTGLAGLIQREINTSDLLDGDRAPETTAFIRQFYNSDRFTQAKGRDRLADELRSLTRKAGDAGQPSMFGDETRVSLADLIGQAGQNRQGDVFETSDDGGGARGTPDEGEPEAGEGSAADGGQAGPEQNVRKELEAELDIAPAPLDNIAFPDPLHARLFALGQRLIALNAIPAADAIHAGFHGLKLGDNIAEAARLQELMGRFVVSEGDGAPRNAGQMGRVAVTYAAQIIDEAGSKAKVEASRVIDPDMAWDWMDAMGRSASEPDPFPPAPPEPSGIDEPGRPPAPESVALSAEDLDGFADDDLVPGPAGMVRVAELKADIEAAEQRERVTRACKT